MAAKRPTGFNDLSAELRNKVYDLSGCLTILPRGVKVEPLTPWSAGVYKHTEEGITIIPFQLKNCFPRFISPAQPALTKVSKQVRDDTLPIFYGKLVLHFEATTRSHEQQVYEWLATIGPEKAGMIRKMLLQLPPPKQKRDSLAYSRIAKQLSDLGVKDRAIIGEDGRSFEELAASIWGSRG